MAIEYGNTEIQEPQLNNFLGNEEEVKRANNLFQNTDMVKLIEAYTDDDLPKELDKTKLKNRFWAFLGRAPKLTFLGEKDKYEYEYFLHNAQINFLLSIPPYEYTFDDDMLLDNLSFHHFLNMTRSMGAQTQVINERTMEASTINHSINSSTQRLGEIQKTGGMMNKIKSVF